jgi:TonB-dependent receptor-like protein
VTVAADTNEILGSAKLDWKITNNHTLTIRYNLQRDLASNELVQTGPNTDGSGLVNSVVHDNTLNIGMISTLTPHIVNEARFFWHRFLSQTPDSSTLPGESLPSAYVGADFCCPQSALQSRFQYVDNLSWTRGTHTFKFGANISHFPYDSGFQQYHYGEYSNFAPGNCTNSFFPQADGLCPSQFTIGFGTGYVTAADNIYGLYAQDAWQIRPNITINYGLRYDVEIGAFKGGTIVDPSVKGGCLQANGLVPACGADHNNFQPRVGIAWSPNFDSGLLHKVFGNPGRSVVRIAGAEVTELAYLNVVLDSLNFDGNTLLTQGITAGSIGTDGVTTGQSVLNAYPNEPSTNLLALFKPIGFYGRVRPISPSIRNPEIHMGSMSYQRQIGNTFTFSVGYQGVFGHGLFGETDTNFPTPVADPAHAGFFYFQTIPGTTNDRPDGAFNAIRTNFSDRSSGYNALVITAEKRLSKHFQFTSSYTWSHTIANGEDFFGLSEPANPLAPLSQETASAQEDIRHLVNFNFIADSNNLVGNHLVGAIVNNWTFGLLSTLQSGRPYPISTGDGAFAGDNFPALGSETNQRPNICNAGSTITGCTGAPVGALIATNIASISGTNYEISQAGINTCLSAGVSGCPTTPTTFAAPANASAFGPVDSISGTPVDFQYISGNLARNAGQSDALYRFDVSFAKAIPIPKWESAKLELKLEVFNVFNHPLFILNNGNDVLNFLTLPSFTATNALGQTIVNPNYGDCVSCINPQTGLYVGANGQTLTLKNFQRASQNAAQNFSGLGGASGDVTPRIMQLAIRFRW